MFIVKLVVFELVIVKINLFDSIKFSEWCNINFENFTVNIETFKCVNKEILKKKTNNSSVKSS